MFSSSYSKGDCEGLDTYLSNFDFSRYYRIQSHNIDFIWINIKLTLINAMYQFIPRIKILSNQQPN